MEMKHCRTMRRPDGSRVKIEVRLEEDCIGIRGSFIYKAQVFTCPKGKRTWVSTFNADDFSYRRLDRELRCKHEYDSMFQNINKEELAEVERELWLKLEPTLGGITSPINNK